MFGYVQANTALLTPEELKRYRGIYCGVCRSLRRRHGGRAAMALNYDMVFLVLLLSSVRPGAGAEGTGRCLPHPVKSHPWITLPYTDYAADMNVLLAYYNCLDDWQDDRSVSKRTAAELLKPAARRAGARWPVQRDGVKSCLARLSELEKQGGGPDETAGCFGRLMGTLFVPEKDAPETSALQSLGEALGQFIYLMDACLDLRKDLKRCRFNPLAGLAGDDFTPLLTMLMGECTNTFEALPLHGDEALLRNILYSGVWCKYRAAQEKEKRSNGGTPA